MFPIGEVVYRDAILSECGLYRYLLSRTWNDKDDARFALFIMLNPSVADASIDDPTIRRCIGFAKSWGCDGLNVVNLFALRATDPRELYKAPDPIGPLNDDSLRFQARAASLVVAAWGAHGKFRGRDGQVLAMLQAAGVTVECLGRTKDGAPRHPLYLPADVQREVMVKGGVA